jgi:hypothetical protein
MAGLLPGILTSDLNRREFITLLGGATTTHEDIGRKS